MPETLLRTKLFIPPPRPNLVPRPRLIERLNQSLQLGHRLTLISAPAGFGKTTLVSEWVAGCERPAAWLSLDEGDNDPTRFLTYLVAALQTLALSEVEGEAEGTAANFGEELLAVLQSLQPPPVESILTALLNEIAIIPDDGVLVLDDYHVIDAAPVEASTSADASTNVDDALAFLLEHLPPQMHLVIATREDPHLPLARLRGRGHLAELRVADLRFTPSEAARFLYQVMGLKLSAEDISALETRTEGWIAGLQLAALALQGLALHGQISRQGYDDAASFIKSFTGSHHFVVDYLVEEVLQQQPQSVQTFLLRTSILDRMCGPLCDAVVLDSTASGQETLAYLERANLFVVPLDDERRWYRYHHLFADLLRQRLGQSAASSTVEELHSRASVWYEDNGLEIEAFSHAAAGNDVERAERLIEGEGMPLHFRGAIAPVMNWLASLPATVLDARPSLWVTYASALTMVGQPISSVEEKLQAAETVLQDAEPNDQVNDLIGHIAAIRAMLAVPQGQVETILTQARRALEYLRPDNLAVRPAATWTLGWAYQSQGDRAAASQTYTEAISTSQASGNIMITIAATTCLGQVQEAENQLYLATESYQKVLQLAGDTLQMAACEAYLGLARVNYQWNYLGDAEQQAQRSLQLARQMETVDTPAACGVLLARLELVKGDVAGAAATLAEAEQFLRQRDLVYWLPDVAAVQVLTLLRQENLAAAAQLAAEYDLSISQARIHLAQGETAAALAVLEPYHRQVETRGWQDERLKVLILQAIARHVHGERDRGVQLLGEALTLAEPGGFIRIFVDEGTPMMQLLSAAAAHGIMPGYTGKLLAAFEAEKQQSEDRSYPPSDPTTQPLIEPLSQRELEVLQLIAQGLSNRQIGERLFLALSTVKGHNRNIFAKLQVQRRTEAIVRARELGLVEL